jgi:hypothetical protein
LWEKVINEEQEEGYRIRKYQLSARRERKAESIEIDINIEDVQVDAIDGRMDGASVCCFLVTGNRNSVSFVAHPSLPKTNIIVEKVLVDVLKKKT